MLQLTGEAQSLIRDFLQKTDTQVPVRIVFTTTVCNQPAMGLALSEAQEGDRQFDFHGVSLVVAGPLWDVASPIEIDLVETVSGIQFCVSCSIAESTCLIAEEPDSCRTYCMTCTCRDEDLPAGL